MKVVVVAEYYPRAADPALGVWAHEQALAARAAGVDVRVLALHRPVPPLQALRRPSPRALAAALRQPPRAVLDGIPVAYVPFLAPPRPLSYGTWGAWAAPPLARALRRLQRAFPFDLVHAHYAAPAGDAVRRAGAGAPLVVSVHGGDVLWVARRSAFGRRAVTRTLGEARVVLANSEGMARRAAALGARAPRVVHLGTDVPAAPAPEPPAPMLVTVAHLVARKRHADVLHALALLRDRHPDLRWRLVGEGPERPRLLALARALGVADRVELLGALPPASARATARAATLFVLPSVDEAFGVAYVEAMAAGVPAVGVAGEDGPEEIARAGGGIVLVPGRDPAALADALAELLADPGRRRALRAQARATVASGFSWAACGRATVAAYADALGS